MVTDRLSNPDPDEERLLDELLVLRVQEGSRAAMEHLVTRWQERLWRYAFRLTGSDDGAWDVLQDSWMAVSRGISRLRDPGAFRSWLYTIVTRAAANRIRRRGPETAVAPEILDEVTDTRAAASTESTEREEAVISLRLAMKRLPREQQALLYMHYLEGFSLWELSGILGIPEGTVKSRLFHARQRVKQLLERTS